MKIFGRGVWASLAALFLFCGVSSESAWAKAFDMEMTGITVTAEKSADQAGSNTFYLDSPVKVECRYRWGEFELRNPPPPLVIQFFHEPADKNFVNFRASAAGPPAAAGTIGVATAGFQTYTKGTIKVWCDIYKQAGGNFADANTQNNQKTAYITVLPRPPAKLGSAPGKAAALKPGMGVVPGLSGNVKQCPTSLFAAVKVDPYQLVSPLNSPADTAETKVVLYLQKSEAAANNVNCHYASHNKDVPNLVVTIKCPNASPQGGQNHSFTCGQ